MLDHVSVGEDTVRASGWNNGRPARTGAGYGIRIRPRERSGYFDPGWSSVVLEVDGEGLVVVSLSRTFWTSCPELRRAAVGRWLLRRGLAPWPAGKPPKVALRRLGGNRFGLQAIG